MFHFCGEVVRKNKVTLMHAVTGFLTCIWTSTFSCFLSLWCFWAVEVYSATSNILPK